MEKQAYTHERLVNAGVELIAESRFSLHALRAACGNASTKTIYQWLRKLQQEDQLRGGQAQRLPARTIIVDAAIHRTWQQFVQFLNEEEATPRSNPIELLKRVTERIVNVLWEQPHLVIFLTRETPSWAQKRLRSFDPYQKNFWHRAHSIICQAQDQGLIDATIEPDLCLRMLYGALQEALYGFALRPTVSEQYSAKDVIDLFERLLNSLGDRHELEIDILPKAVTYP